MSGCKLEVCCGDIRSVRAAINGGAHRVELCQALDLDGITPSAGMVRTAVATGIDVHVLIRPREGDFVYDGDEVECMLYDIREARRLGAEGVVIGALTKEGYIDMDTCRRLAEEARGMNITFHRAFDVCRNPLGAFEQIYSLGCNRLLTSGQAPTAAEGTALLRQLVDMADKFRQKEGRTITVMPGCGVNAGNARGILEKTGAMEIHGSLRRDGHTDPDTVRAVVDGIKGYRSSTAGV